MGVYIPNFLGWFHFVALIPLCFIIFLISVYKNIKDKKYKVLTTEFIVFGFMLSFCVLFWFYKTGDSY